jgi:hypothetical protein
MGPEVGLYLGWEPENGARTWLQSAYEGRESFIFGGVSLAPELNYITQQESRELSGLRSGAVPDRREWDALLQGRRVDLVWSHSVFTHMWPEDAVANLKLLKESSNSGAVMVHTWLILDDYAATQVSQGKADRDLPFEVAGIRTLSRTNPLDCTAYPLSLMTDVYRQAGVDVSEVKYGSWAGRDNGVTYVDMVVSQIP